MTAVTPAAAAELAAAGITLPAPVEFCGPAGHLARDGDLNADWTCDRTRRLYAAESSREYLIDTAGRLAAMTNRHRADALRNWLRTEGVRRVSVIEQLREDAARTPCGHAPADRRPLPMEDALPACG